MMTDARFFSNHGPFRLSRLAEIAGATLAAGADPAPEICDVAPLESTGPDDIAFLHNPRHVEVFARTLAGACIVAEKYADRAPAGVAVLLSQQPYQAFARVAQAFYPQLGRVRTGDDCHIGANATFARGSGDAKFANSGVRSPPSSD